MVHNSEGTLISVEIVKKDNIEIIIKDNGIGISKSDLKHIFKNIIEVLIQVRCIKVQVLVWLFLKK
ncbi:ATP-binding protein [Clostridioides difficile]|uniref:ATP-binding protein n=1 Tax=Clostridioides difficile TaxID=1496 RepID=UPI002237C4D6